MSITVALAFAILAVGGLAAYKSRVLGIIVMGLSLALTVVYASGVNLFDGDCGRFVSCSQPDVHYVGKAVIWSVVWAAACVVVFVIMRRLRRYPR